MIELSIPQPGEESKNVKDLVFTILTAEQPLSIIELTNRIKKKHIVAITYQAVRKAVNTLHDQGVLIKTGKKYSINKKWVLNLKTFFDKLLTTYETKTPIKLFTTELAKEDYAVYTFNNLLDLDNFWGDIMRYWADHIKKGELKEYVSYYHYGWWFLINLGRETKLFEHFAKKRIKSYLICLENLPLNRWGAKIYKDTGAKIKIESRQIDEFVDLNILGDTVIQVKYPPKIFKRLKQFYRKYKNVQEMSLKEITQIAHEPCDIKFIMFKNPTIAKNLRETYKKKI